MESNIQTSKYKWTFTNSIDENELSEFAHTINVPLPLARALMNRGIRSFDAAKSFFRPTTDQMHDPFLMKDMDKAVYRIKQAIDNKEKIMIYGDYDVDGTTGTALLYSFFKDIGCSVEYYINDRIKEGYGIALSGIDWAKENGISVIISVDCGITAFEQANYCRSKQIDLIICDHHTVGDQLPDAYAILNPKRPDCDYPFKELCGCGVGYKFTAGVSNQLNLSAAIADQYLDLVAVAIAADIVSLTGENRIMSRRGIEIIQENPRAGWVAMEKKAGLTLDNVSSSQIVFNIGPRINAVGRLGDAKRAVAMMTAKTVDEAIKFAEILETENHNRRAIDEDTFLDAAYVAEQYLNNHSGLSIVLHNEAWHPGVIGIVASRLVEKYFRPAIMLTTIDGVAKGSARSIPGFDIYEAIKACEKYVVQFGGHKYAAGLTIEVDNIPAFQSALDDYVQANITPDMLVQEIKIDTPVSLEDIDQRFWKILKQFQPHGPENMRPVFYSEKVKVVGYPSVVGKGHLKFKVKQGNSETFEVIGYNLESLYHHLNPKNGGIEMVYTIGENCWNGKTTLQFQLKDIANGD